MAELDLSDLITTKSQAADFLSRLANLIDSLYGTDFHLEKALLDSFGIRKKDRLMSLIRDSGLQPDNPAVLKEFFERVQTAVSALPTVSLTLPFEPDESTLSTISLWFPQNINRQVLLDIIVDRELVAGSSVNYNGKSKDYSVKAVLTRILAASLAGSPPPSP